MALQMPVARYACWSKDTARILDVDTSLTLLGLRSATTGRQGSCQLAQLGELAEGAIATRDGCYRRFDLGHDGFSRRR